MFFHCRCVFGRTLFIFFLLFSIISCEDLEEQIEEAEDEETEVELETGEGSTPTTGSSVDSISDVRVFIFGNSLVVHEVTPEPTEEKKVPHWLGLLAEGSGLNFAVDGRYGFLRSYADFSELSPQWGFESASSIWTNESVPFADIDYNRIILTPTNFIQYQSSIEPYYDDPNTTPLSTSLSTIDQINAAHPGVPIFIYAGWADMAGFGSFPDSINLSDYYTYELGEYTDWFLDYHDRLIRARPNIAIKMIPVGNILAKMLTDQLSGLELLDRYEDDAPHGQGSLYFLASLITYSALYKRQAPDYQAPDTVHELIRNQYSSLASFIWSELNNFNHTDGTSRVF